MMEKNTVKATVLAGVVSSAATAGAIALRDKQTRQKLVKTAAAIAKKTTSVFIESRESTNQARKKATKQSRKIQQTAKRQLHALKQVPAEMRRVN